MPSDECNHLMARSVIVMERVGSKKRRRQSDVILRYYHLHRTTKNPLGPHRYIEGQDGFHKGSAEKDPGKNRHCWHSESYQLKIVLKGELGRWSYQDPRKCASYPTGDVNKIIRDDAFGTESACIIRAFDFNTLPRQPRGVTKNISDARFDDVHVREFKSIAKCRNAFR
ncbi:hypothetical protein F2P81_002657 [Scophthalmus maximus]|uniref:Uncharacterized protein n=1 Tax=Scophthalmus maximus TaxID=52904 RepID=A0A6A4TP08_SCOMX|nr:hypothetical protein F2P81_002657 [Scophthalmus maximus]